MRFVNSLCECERCKNLRDFDLAKKFALFLLPFLILIFGILAYKFAHAATPEQLNHDTQSQNDTGIGRIFQTLGTGLDDSISISGIYIWGTPLSGQIEVYLCSKADNSWTGGGDCLGGGAQAYGNSTGLGGSNQEYLITFDNPHTFVASNYYAIRVLSDFIYGSTNSASYPNGNCDAQNFAAACSNGVQDIYFRFAVASNISILSPLDSSTQRGSFPYWNLKWDVYSGTPVNVRVNYGLSTSTWTYSDIASTTATTTSNLVGNFFLPKEDFLSTGVYYAQATINATNTTLATSSIVQFNISFGGATGYWSTSTATTTLSDLTFNCGTVILLSDMCNGIIFLILPDQQSIEQYKQIPNQVSSTFPFAIFYDLQDVFNTASSSSAGQFATTTFNVSSTAISFNVTMFATSSIEQYFGSSNVSLFRTLIASSLWLALGFLMYRQTKNIFYK